MKIEFQTRKTKIHNEYTQKRPLSRVAVFVNGLFRPLKLNEQKSIFFLYIYKTIRKSILLRRR